jgi:hypothetical protein
MNPTPSEEILIKRILDALSDSAKTALGIANYIKAKFYRVETTYEIKQVIRKYLINVKVQFEPYFEVYRLIKSSESNVKDYSNPSQKISKQETIDIPEKVSFLNELYKRRQDLLRLPLEERVNLKRLEIIETNTEIECLKPLAIEELSYLREIDRFEVIKLLFAGLRTELEKIQFPKDKIDSEELEEAGDYNQEENYSEQSHEELFPDEEEDIAIDIDLIDLHEKIYESKREFENDTDDEEIKDIENKNVLPEEILTVEQAIKLVLEEKTRLGTLEGNLLAENIIFRLKKGKWD